MNRLATVLMFWNNRKCGYSYTQTKLQPFWLGLFFMPRNRASWRPSGEPPRNNPTHFKAHSWGSETATGPPHRRPRQNRTTDAGSTKDGYGKNMNANIEFHKPNRHVLKCIYCGILDENTGNTDWLETLQKQHEETCPGPHA